MRFERLRADPLLAGTEAEAELLGASAMVAAARGEGDAAGSLAWTARRLARHHGATDVRVRVHRSLAEVGLLLEDTATARRELSAAKELIGGEDAGLPAEDVVGVLAAELACGLDEASAVGRAVRLMPEALADTSAWWDLARLVPVALAHGEAGNLRRDDGELTLGLRALVVAGRQRADCQPAAGGLAAWLG